MHDGRDLDLLRSQALTEAGFAHGFSLKPLDFADRVPAEVRAEHTARLAALVGIDASGLRQVIQVHGARVVVASGKNGRAEEADALVARRHAPPGATSVGVRVADCVPVLVGDPETGHVAAIHAGWRGLVAGVVGAAIAELAELGGASRAIAAIGPCIGPCCFEVGHDVGDTIVKATERGVIAQRAADKCFVDLRRGVRFALRAARLDDARIEDVPGCTRCDATRFHSFRRDAKESGRMLAVIGARA